MSSGTAAWRQALSLRESTKSLRVYFFLAAILGALGNVATLSDAILRTAQVQAVLGLMVSLAYCISAIRLRVLLVKAPWFIYTTLLVSGLFSLASSVVMYESGQLELSTGLVGLVVLILLLTYLYKTTKRLRIEELVRLENPERATDDMGPRVFGRITLVAVLALVVTIVAFGSYIILFVGRSSI